ncbi:MAG: hypothetical protein CMJ64_29540 [Planctomycetaceae bacterium]|nr:hypothetical protein [Planctomycetaceae bacterium]
MTRLKRILAGACCSAAALCGCATSQLATHQSQPKLVQEVARQPLHRLPPATAATPNWPVQLAALQDVAEPESLTPPQAASDDRSNGGLGPRSVAEALGQGAGEEITAVGEPTLQLDLTSTLALVSGQSPVVAHAAARYEEAYARLAEAKVLWVPSLRAGMSYHHHDGNYQASSGGIVDVDRSSLQTGLGVGAVGAGTTPVPGVVAQFHATDAVFQPRIAEHVASARSHSIDAAMNDTLLDAALAYLELLRSEQLRAVANKTEQHARELAKLTAVFAETGQGPQADADRAKTEAAIRANDVARAEEAVDVANARLVEVLSADPYTRVAPTEPTIVPLDLVEADLPPGELLATGLSNRPELGAARHLVSEAIHRYERERFAPLLPSVLLGMSQSSLGGGLGSTIGDSRRRFDFDAVAFWEVRNFGFGERASRDQHWSAYEQRQLEEVRLMDQVAREINEAHAQVRSRKGQIAVAESAVETATASYTRNLERIRQGEGLPIEVLQSIQALDQARREYVRTVIDYNASQFRLHRAVGWAIQ